MELNPDASGFSSKITGITTILFIIKKITKLRFLDDMKATIEIMAEKKRLESENMKKDD